MKKIILIFCVLFSAMQSFAQDSNVKVFEVEIGFGLSQGGKFNNASSTLGGALFVEPRYNIKNTPFDVGLQILLSDFNRDKQTINNHIYNEHVMPRTFIAYADYNLRKWNSVSLFGGLGIGYAQVFSQYQTDDSSFWDRYSTKTHHVGYSARIGAEFIHHIRLTVDYKLINKKSSFFGVTVGGVIGGGKK